MAQKEAIMRALMEAMSGSGAPSKSIRPKMRPKGMPMRPKMRPNMIGASPSGGTRGIDPAENYSPEDLDRLLKSSRGEVSRFKKGGAVKKKAAKKPAKKSKNGCVMKGRGGKYKGMK